MANGYTDEELAKKSWDELLDIRLQNAENRKLNEILAPYEHRAFAREQVAEKPYLAPLYTILPFGYQAAKLAGYRGWDGRATPASLSQLVGGLQGTWEGVKSAFNKASQ